MMYTGEETDAGVDF